MIAFVERLVSLAYSAVGMTIDFNSLILILRFREVGLQIGWRCQRTWSQHLAYIEMGQTVEGLKNCNVVLKSVLKLIHNQ